MEMAAGRDENLESPQRSVQDFIHLSVANQKEIFFFILCLVPMKSDAEDLLQETLIEMWKKFDQFRRGSDFIAWGVTIAKFKVMNYRKKKLASNRKIFSDHIYNALQTDFQTNSNKLHDTIEMLKSCVRKLSSDEKGLLKLRYEKDQTLNAISSRVGKSAQAIHKALSRIHVKLAKCIRVTRANLGEI